MAISCCYVIGQCRSLTATIIIKSTSIINSCRELTEGLSVSPVCWGTVGSRAASARGLHWCISLPTQSYTNTHNRSNYL